jgi:hypothetical protein
MLSPFPIPSSTFSHYFVERNFEITDEQGLSDECVSQFSHEYVSRVSRHIVLRKQNKSGRASSLSKSKCSLTPGFIVVQD